MLGASALLASQLQFDRFAEAALARNPMAFPGLLLLLFAFAGATLLLRGFRGSRPHAMIPVDWPRVIAVAVLLAAYFAAFQPLGFLPTSAVFFPAVVVLLGYRRPSVVLAVTIIALVVLWFLFAKVFVVRPPGVGLDELARSLLGLL